MMEIFINYIIANQIIKEFVRELMHQGNISNADIGLTGTDIPSAETLREYISLATLSTAVRRYLEGVDYGEDENRYMNDDFAWPTSLNGNAYWEQQHGTWMRYIRERYGDRETQWNELNPEPETPNVTVDDFLRRATRLPYGMPDIYSNKKNRYKILDRG